MPPPPEIGDPEQIKPCIKNGVATVVWFIIKKLVPNDFFFKINVSLGSLLNDHVIHSLIRVSRDFWI